MARRIDIELTSARPDGTWTWRAAGAMQPRGVLDGQLLDAEARAGDVVRAEADFELDGISITSVTAPKPKKRAEPERIELLTSTAPTTGVTTQLVGRGDRRPSEGRRGRDDGRGADSRTGRGRPPSGDRPRDGAGSARPARRAGGDGAGPTQGRPPTDRPAGDRDRRPDRPSGDRDRRSRDSAGESRGARARPERTGARPRIDGTAPSGPAESTARATAGRRLNPGNAHRQAVMASLSPEQQPIAEQVLRGGIPAVRTAIHLEREKATAEGRPAPNADSLLAIAEELLPRLKAAEWRDRAEAAAKAADTLTLRDLRSVVAGGDLARDDETRQLAASLRERLEARLTSMREEWALEIALHLDEGRVVRALRLASRSPEATTRLSAEQAQRLNAAAGAAMSPDTAPDRWIALLEAVAASPVRRSVVPVGLPPEPGAALLTAAQQQVGRVPSLARLLGISMPPPPGPARGGPGSRPAPPRRRGPGRARAIPAPPSDPAAPAGATAPATEVPAAATAPLDEVPTEEPAATTEVTAGATAPPTEAPAPPTEQTAPATEQTAPATEASTPQAEEPTEEPTEATANSARPGDGRGETPADDRVDAPAAGTVS